MILSGEARLLARDQARIFTLRKLRTSELVGLASLVRAASCEEVTASTEVRALALPDAEILRLMQEEVEFRNFCEHQLWPAELFALLQPLVDALSPACEPLVFSSNTDWITVVGLPAGRLESSSSSKP